MKRILPILESINLSRVAFSIETFQYTCSHSGDESNLDERFSHCNRSLMWKCIPFFSWAHAIRTFYCYDHYRYEIFPIESECHQQQKWQMQCESRDSKPRMKNKHEFIAIQIIWACGFRVPHCRYESNDMSHTILHLV